MEFTAQEVQNTIEVTVIEITEDLMTQNTPEDTDSVNSVAGTRLVFGFVSKTGDCLEHPWL